MSKSKIQKKNIDRRVAWANKKKAAGMCMSCGKQKIAPTSTLYGACCLEPRRASYHEKLGKPVPKRRLNK